MKKLSILLAVVVLAAAVGIGVLVNQQNTVNKDLAKIETNLEKSQAELAAANEDLKAAKAELEAATTKEAELNTDLETAKTELEAAKTELSTAQETLKTTAGEKLALETKVIDLETKVKELEAQKTEGEGQAATAAQTSSELETAKTELSTVQETLKTTAEEKLALETKVTDLETKVKDLEEKLAQPAAEAPAQAEEAALAPLPEPVDTTKTFLKNKDDKEESPCTPGDFGPTCSAINNTNLLQFLKRPDVHYIDTRDHGDYMKKHLRDFEVIPFFGLIFNAEAHTNADLPQLYGGTPTEPVPVYEESDEILKALFPKDKTLFIMCQSGSRVDMLMNILKARGWDMSKVYNIGGMAQYTGAEYRDLIVDTPEMVMTTTYNMEGLTRIKP